MIHQNAKYQNKRLLRCVALPNKTLISNVKHEYNLTQNKIKCIQNGTMRENKRQFCNNKTVYHSGNYILLPVFGKKVMIKN